MNKEDSRGVKTTKRDKGGLEGFCALHITQQDMPLRLVRAAHQGHEAAQLVHPGLERGGGGVHRIRVRADGGIHLDLERRDGGLQVLGLGHDLLGLDGAERGGELAADGRLLDGRLEQLQLGDGLAGQVDGGGVGWCEGWRGGGEGGEEDTRFRPCE